MASGTDTGSGAPPARTGDTPMRLRLVALETPAGVLDFGAGASCVITPPGAGDGIADAIARSVIGPRSPGARGAVDIGGRSVQLQSLPAPLLRPSAQATVDASLLGAIHQELLGARAAELETECAHRRLGRHRLEVRIERASAQVRADHGGDAPAPTTPAPDETATRIDALLEELSGLEPVAPVVALELAAEFDAFEAAQSAGRPTDGDIAPQPTSAPAPEAAVTPGPDARDLLAVARARAAHPSSAGLLGDRAAIEAAHRAVAVAEAEVARAGRRDRAAARTRYDAAVAAERDALERAGVTSYAAFLLGLTTGATGAASVPAPMLVARPVAPDELGPAPSADGPVPAPGESARRDDEIGDAAADDIDEATWERETELRARAAAMLGHFPGEDPATELRSLRRDHPDAERLRARLVEELGAAGVACAAHDDVETAARAVLVMRRADRNPRRDASGRRPHRTDDLARLLHDRDRNEAALARVEQELAAVIEERAVPFARLDAAGAAAVVRALIARYRSGALLAGRLPLVVDRAFDGLADDALAACARVVAETHDAQVIVVSDRAQTGERMAGAGATMIVLGPDDPAGEAAALVGAPVCPAHERVPAVASCAQCGRAACASCVVAVAEEPGLWCASCADALRDGSLRLLRRRGA